MNVFGSNSKGIKVYGPVVSVDVTCGDMGDMFGKSWLLTDVHVGAREILDVRQCFNDVSFIYAMGNSQSQCRISLSFAIFLSGNKCDGNGDFSSISKGLDQYKTCRISNKKGSPIQLSIGRFSRNGYLAGINIGPVDLSKGICHADVHFLMKL